MGWLVMGEMVVSTSIDMMNRILELVNTKQERMGGIKNLRIHTVDRSISSQFKLLSNADDSNACFEISDVIKQSCRRPELYFGLIQIITKQSTVYGQVDRNWLHCQESPNLLQDLYFQVYSRCFQEIYDADMTIVATSLLSIYK